MLPTKIRMAVLRFPTSVVDAVRYNDKAPWPIAAAGGGPSLERINSAAFGNDPVNWRASNGPASPGLDNNGNRPPQVNAGVDGSATAITFPVDVPLAPTVTDDGFPAPAQLTYAWTQVSGPGVVVFANAAARSTTASLPGVGRYVCASPFPTANSRVPTTSSSSWIARSPVDLRHEGFHLALSRR